MNVLDRVLKMISMIHESGKVPKTVVMSTADFDTLNLPTWTKQLFGLKLVIAANMPQTFVTEHEYHTTTTKKVDPYDLREYQKEKAHVRH